MIPPSTINLDPREAEELLATVLARRLGYVPEWRPSKNGSDIAVTEIVTRYLHAIIQRLNLAPAKNGLAFLDLLGIQLTHAQAARAPIVFQLADSATAAHVPAGTRLAAPPPLGNANQIIFETERGTGLSPGKLAQVVSLWPGRDQYIDHSAALSAGQPFQPFKKNQLKDTPHVIYLAHDTLLALSGESRLKVDCEVTTASSKPLDIFWEYWDGQVWREFVNMRQSVGGTGAGKQDTTVGLTGSGFFVLETESATTAKRRVGGMEAFWVRGRLIHPLLPDPAHELPQIDSIKLSTEISRRFSFLVSPPVITPRDSQSPKDLVVKVISDGGAPLTIAGSGGGQTLNQATVSGSPQTVAMLTLTPNQSEVPKENVQAQQNATEGEMPPPGQIHFDIVGDRRTALTLALTLNDIDANQTLAQSTALRPLDSQATYTVTFTLTGLKPDQAFADQAPLNITKTFYPFGSQPQAGTAFYFTNEEVFSKPGAAVKILAVRVETPQDPKKTDKESDDQEPKTLDHLIAWEYWNGTRWTTLFQTDKTCQPFAARGNSSDFGPQFAAFTMPADIVRTTVNNEDSLWMRALLVSGGFGYTKKIALQEAPGVRAQQLPDSLTVTFFQPPALSDFLLAYDWTQGPSAPERVLAYNDFQYADRTEEAKWPGKTFQPFKKLSDNTPALYLGFDKKLPVDRLGLLFSIVEQPGSLDGPAMLWEYSDGFSWTILLVEDETRNLRLPGLVSFIGPDDGGAVARFDTPLYWLRARLKEDGVPGETTITSIFPNAVWAIQHQTIVEEPLGVSTGRPTQVFGFRQSPVLTGERIEVREIAGARASVEWRIVAMQLFNGSPQVLFEIESMLAAEGPQIDIRKGNLHLTRDRNKRVTEVWVRWQGQRNFFFSGPNDRHYVVERARGRLLFGDGKSGKTPPLGAPIVARQYVTGGGLAGNVAANTITQVLGPVGGLNKAFNPVPAEGGGDGESPGRFVTRGPRTIRHRGRALVPEDYETLAREANASVAVANAIACRDPGGRGRSGWVTLVIIPQSDETRPWPSFGLREEVQNYIAARAPADLAAANQIYVTGPDYVAVDVHATLVPRDTADAGEVEKTANRALQDFLHPLRGGPNQRGWSSGRDVFLSDVAMLLGRVDGVDHVEELALLLNGVLQGERVTVAESRIVVAGDIRLKLEEVRG